MKGECRLLTFTFSAVNERFRWSHSPEYAVDSYLEDSTVPEGSVCPTYAVAVLKIHNRRWDGVPFIMKAGKALDERKVPHRFSCCA